MRVILGLDAADAGTALVGGRPYRSLRRPLSRVGSLLDAGALQPSRTGRNHLLWLARSQGLPRRRVDEVIAQVGPGPAVRRKAGGYSLGMRQRLGIAAALLGDPPVLMLDEPFNGMDPEGIVWMRGFLRSLAAEGPGGAGVQPPDERTAGHRRPPGDRRPRPGHRGHQHGATCWRPRPRTGSRCGPPRRPPAVTALEQAGGRRGCRRARHAHRLRAARRDGGGRPGRERGRRSPRCRRTGRRWRRPTWSSPSEAVEYRAGP